MTGHTHIHRSERGAVFVQVGIAVFVLMAFNVFVIDYGMLWVSRRQAQNAADAGALAGALSRGYDDFSNPPASDSVVVRAATQVAAANLVWQQAPATDVSFGCPAGTIGRCVQVDVFRTAARGNPIGTFFGPILGITTQNVQATATALLTNGNATPCLRPVALADGWLNNLAPAASFEHYTEPGGAPIPGGDVYTSPGPSSPGGTTVGTWFGERVNWSVSTNPLTAPITRELMLPLDLPGPDNFGQDMLNCNGTTVAVTQTLPVDPAYLASPAAFFTTFQGISQQVFDTDPLATYDVGDSDISNTCAPNCAPVSPRLLAIALYNPDLFQKGRATNDWVSAGCPTNAPCITISNIAGYFVHCVDSRPCIGGSMPSHGHFLKYPGTFVDTEPTFPDNGSWLVSTHLVR